MSKSSLRTFLVVLSFSVPVIISSCRKKWTKPASLSVEFKIENNSSSSPVKFTDGCFYLSKFSLKGDRKQGTKHVELKQEFSPVLGAVFNSSSSVNAGFTFDVPQGTYNYVDVEFDIDESASGISLVANGYYINVSDDTLLVVFEFDAEDVFSLRALSPSGTEEIVFIEDVPVACTIVVSPDEWFATVPETMLENAVITTIDDNDGIRISENENNDIYILIANRIKNGMFAYIR